MLKQYPVSSMGVVLSKGNNYNTIMRKYQCFCRTGADRLATFVFPSALSGNNLKTLEDLINISLNYITCVRILTLIRVPTTRHKKNTKYTKIYALTQCYIRTSKLLYSVLLCQTGFMQSSCQQLTLCYK